MCAGAAIVPGDDLQPDHGAESGNPDCVTSSFHEVGAFGCFSHAGHVERDSVCCLDDPPGSHFGPVGNHIHLHTVDHETNADPVWAIELLQPFAVVSK